MQLGYEKYEDDEIIDSDSEENSSDQMIESIPYIYDIETIKHVFFRRKRSVARC